MTGICLKIQDQGVYFSGTTVDLSEDFAQYGRVSYVSPGGDDAASVITNCITNSQVPHLGSKCIISDDDGVFFLGYLGQPEWHLKTNEIAINIKGYGHHLEDQRWPDSFIIVQGTTIEDAMTLAVGARCPEITGGFIVGPTGIMLDADSEDFQGQSASDVLNFLCSLTYYLTTEVVWHVRPNPTAGFEWSALPAMEFRTRNLTAEYIVDAAEVLKHPDGDIVLKESSDSVVNRVTVAWDSGRQWDQEPDVGVPIDYDNIVIIRDKFLNASRDIASSSSAHSLASGLLNRFNSLRGAGDQITVPCEVVICNPSTNLPIHPWRVRAGKIIRLRNMPSRGEYGSLSYIDRYIVKAEHDFKTGITTLQTGELINIGTVIRSLNSGWERRGAIPFQQGTVNMPFAQNDKLPVRGDVMPSVWSGDSGPAVPMMDVDLNVPYDHKIQPGLLGEVVVNFIISGGASPPAITLGRGVIGIPECRLDTWKIVATDTNGLVVDTAAVRVYKNTVALAPDVALSAANSNTGTFTGTDAVRSFNGTTDNLMFDLQVAPATAIVLSVTLRGVRL